MDTPLTWLITNGLAALLLPPLNLALMGAIGLALMRRRPRLGRSLILAALGLIVALSTPFVAGTLLGLLQAPRFDGRPGDAGAIVVLGGGTYFDAPEYGGDTVGTLTLERLRYAAWLRRSHKLPILVTGGAPLGGTPEAELMRRVLEEEFRVPVRWIETRSATTWDNARMSAEILHREGIRTVLLVSHAWHLPRAVRVFERAGIRVVPAPTKLVVPGKTRPSDFIPNARALWESALACHEGIGLAWYRLRAWLRL